MPWNCDVHTLVFRLTGICNFDQWQRAGLFVIGPGSLFCSRESANLKACERAMNYGSLSNVLLLQTRHDKY